MENKLNEIASILDLKISTNASLTNGVNVEIDKMFNSAIPTIEIIINNDTVLALSLKKDGGIAAKIYRGFDNFRLFNKEFKLGPAYGMFELDNDNELERFINLFIENLNIELIEIL